MMGYEITSIENNDIHIRHGLRDALDGFITLLKSIASETGGRINQVDGQDVEYIIQDDPYDLVYRWDADGEITVVVKNGSDIDAVEKMLKAHFDKLNN